MKSKKFLTRLLALIISLVSLVGVLSGCQLVNTNMEKDTNLAVMKVQIEDEVDPITIYKKDLYSAYVSYGYYYVNNYGYTVADTYEMIISNYQQNAVVEQFARIKLAELYEKISATTYTDFSEFEEYFKANVSTNLVEEGLTTLKANSDIDLFLTSYQKAEALYNVKTSINSMIDSFAEEEHDHDHDHEEEKESVSLEERANPYVAEEEEELNEWEMKDEATKPELKDIKVAEKKLDKEIPEEVANAFTNIYELNKYVFENYEIDTSTPERAKAFNQAINSYRSLGIIGSTEFYSVNEDANNALKYEYFKNQLKTEKAQMLVLSYQDSLVKEVENKLTEESLYADYVNLYNSQKDKYTSSYESYESVLNELKEDTLLVYNPYDGYGFVSNLLLGFSEEQSAQLTAFKAKSGVTKKEVEDFRSALAQSILVKDQRLSWATTGKMVADGDNKVFEDKYFLSDGFIKDKINGYIGELIGVTESTEEDENGIEKTNYFATNGYANGINVLEFTQNYLDNNNGEVLFGADSNSDMIMDDYATKKESYDNVMKDLIYAFSTDPGSLSAYKGYMYSPYTSATTYVKEFADAAKELIEKGAGSYTLVITDFGIHVMVCTEVIEKTQGLIDFNEFSTALNKEDGATLTANDKFVKNFKKIKQDTLVEEYVSEMANSFVKKYLEEDSKATTFYKDNYKDLV